MIALVITGLVLIVALAVVVRLQDALAGSALRARAVERREAWLTRSGGSE